MPRNVTRDYTHQNNIKSNATLNQSYPQGFLSKLKEILFPKIPYIISILILMAVIIHKTKIRDIQIEGKGQVSSEQERLISISSKEYINSSIFNNSIMLLSSKKLGERLLVNPNVKDIKISKKWPNKIKIDYELKNLNKVWVNGQDQYLMDDNGKLSVKISEISSELVIRNKKIYEVKIGDSVLLSENIVQIDQINDFLRKNEMYIKEIVMEEGLNDIEIMLANYKWVIKMSLDNQYANRITDLNRVLSDVIKNKQSINEYIDIRIPGKIFYY
jgi:hypothetical protein